MKSPFLRHVVTLICAGALRLGAETQPDRLDIPAWAFDRGNVRIFADQWAEGGPMVAFGGESPVWAEYSFALPQDGPVEISLRYAALEARPVAVKVDGRDLGEGCRTATGAWSTREAKWETLPPVTLTKGPHRLRLQREGSFPHLAEVRVQSTTPWPAGWKPAPLTMTLEQALKRPPSPTVEAPNFDALQLAVKDLLETHGPVYPRGAEYLTRLETLKREHTAGADRAAEFHALRREALLANPALDFSDLLLVRRPANAPSTGLPRNWQGNCSLPKKGYDDALCRWSIRQPETAPTVLLQPGGRFLGDVDLHWDGQRALFSMPDEKGRWQIWETNLTDAAKPRALTGDQPDVDSYDPCYLPNGRIIYSSSAGFIGVPCVNGNDAVANLFVMDGDGSNPRRLCFDQEHNWCPTVMNDGRVLYARWEYTDTPHSNTRLLFTMNPDGTGQTAYLGSGSYWPNSFFYARPLPGHATRVVAVIGGHHDNPRMGELVLFDPAAGRKEAEPAVQRIPGRGRPVEPVIRDGLTQDSWPKFLHPYPIDQKTFLVSCKPSPKAPWGLYLADVFDNLVPLLEDPAFALLEPLPLRKTTPPPSIPERVKPGEKDALVVLQDIYAGEGLRGVPRGTVKSLRIFTYHYAYQGMGGLLGVVGMDGPWDMRRIIGTVPVQPDGSARFTIPANTPISLQPLDAEGKALQLMRSWMTAMPGETVQCTGCHDQANQSPPTRRMLAMNLPPSVPEPWHGPVRGFSFAREVQPVLNHHCLPCHQGTVPPDLRGNQMITDWSSTTPGNGGYAGLAGKFSVAYAELHRYVRRPGIESDYHVLEPLEYHHDTTQLGQLLRKGHHGVKLDAEALDRLVTWMDLNTPYHGTWGEHLKDPGPQRERRRELLKTYANVDEDPEALPPPDTPSYNPPPAPATPPPVVAAAPLVKGWPFDAETARQRQGAAGGEIRREIEITPGHTLTLLRVPAGSFVMGYPGGAEDEQAQAAVEIDSAFWMGSHEISNALYALFDPRHDSRVESKNTYQFGVHGYPVNQPGQPVVRVSWDEAMAFCAWLSARTGSRFTLPTEAQWEWACRAGSDTPFSFGRPDADFSRHANFADARLRDLASDPYTVDTPLQNPSKYDDWVPKDTRFNDGALLTVAGGRYQANAWGLFDLHGNAAEWTRSAHRPHPWRADDRDNPALRERRVVKGGSWRDLPARGASGARLDYEPWQRVYNVGFRVVCLDPPPAAQARAR